MLFHNTVYVTGCGRQDCSDMHSWGPGIRQNYIIHHIIKGSGYLKLGGRQYQINAGECFLTFPGMVIHYFPDSLSPWEYEWIDFTGETIPSLLKYTPFNRKSPVCHLPSQVNIEYYFNRLLSIDIYNQHRFEATGILASILGCFMDCLPNDNHVCVERRDDRLANALYIIKANYHKADFHISSLCAKLMVNRITLYRLFKNAQLVAPNYYLLNYRLEQSRLLLQQGFSVKQTALSCGFTDQFYFSRIFKKYTGEAPSLIPVIKD